MNSSMIVDLLMWYVIFLFSTSLHEAAHSIASAWGGDDTAYRAGSATLNPLPHMQREKMGMIIVPLLSFFLYHGQWMIGWASAPFNPYWAARYPKRSFVMSLAGPLSHLIPASVAWLAMGLGLKFGYFFPYPFGMDLGLVGADPANTVAWALAKFLNILFSLNIILLVLNLIPAPPLDGSEVWYLFVKREEARLRLRYQLGSYGMIGFLIAGFYIFPRVFPKVYGFLATSLYSLFAWNAG